MAVLITAISSTCTTISPCSVWVYFKQLWTYPECGWHSPLQFQGHHFLHPSLPQPCNTLQGMTASWIYQEPRDMIQFSVGRCLLQSRKKKKWNIWHCNVHFWTAGKKLIRLLTAQYDTEHSKSSEVLLLQFSVDSYFVSWPQDSVNMYWNNR
jgi:hypothetical protein